MPLLRIAGSILSFTTGAAGGVFAPALSAGASIGSTLSGWMHLTADNTNLLVLSGMVGFLTGVTRTPFTSAILVLEMTDRHNLIFHLMLAGMIASLVAILIDRHSFYDHLKFQYMHELIKEENAPGAPTASSASAQGSTSPASPGSAPAAGPDAPPAPGAPPAPDAHLPGSASPAAPPSE